MHEVEQRVVGPVQVLEHQHQRVLPGQRFEEPPPGGKRLDLPVLGRLTALLDAQQRTQLGFHPGRFPGIGEARGDRCVQLAGRAVDPVGMQNPGRRPHHLGQRPEGDALAIGKRPAFQAGDRPVAVLLDPAKQLEHQPALADPRDAHHGYELRCMVLARTHEG